MKTKHEIILDAVKHYCQDSINKYFKYIQEEEEDGHHYSTDWFTSHNLINTYKEILELIESKTNEN